MYVNGYHPIFPLARYLTWNHPKATKVGAIVGGQTSCKAPELAAFDKHLPPDVEVVSCHSLHGPKVNPKGQPLVRLYLHRWASASRATRQTWEITPRSFHRS